jgi:hypothetical protein
VEITLERILSSKLFSVWYDTDDKENTEHNSFSIALQIMCIDGAPICNGYALDTPQTS